MTDGGLNYHEFLLARSPDGQVVTEDMYVFLSGEMLTQTFRRFLLNFLASPEQGGAVQLRGPDQLYVKHAREIGKMATAIQKDRGKEALAIFRKLPADLQKDKVIQLIAIRAAQDGDEAEYLVELERFRKAHPEDVAIDFLSIDYHIIKKQYDEALKALGRADKAVGGDPYLQVIKGGLLIQAGRFQQARTTLEKAVKDEPKLIHGYWALVSLALEEKNHAETAVWLKKIEESGLAEYRRPERPGRQRLRRVRQIARVREIQNLAGREKKMKAPDGQGRCRVTGLSKVVCLSFE